MELVSTSDLFVTATLAILLSFLVAKLVLLAMSTDTHAATNRRDEPVFLEERFTVQTARSQSRVGFISPVQVAAVVETEQSVEEEATVELDPNVVDEFSVKSDIAGDVTKVKFAGDERQIGFISPVQVAAVVDTERNVEEEATAESDSNVVDEFPVKSDIAGDVTKEKFAGDESWIGFISPVQVAIETECNVEEAINVSDSNVTDEFPVKSDVSVEVPKEKIAEEEIDDSAEQRNPECVAENVISVEKPVVSVTDSVLEERDVGDEDDDWEGIERSELEKEFMVATEFVVGGESDRLASVGSDVQMEMYALHKVATEGPCRDPQPMPLKLSARAKWNAWQKLGNMSPEVAMEQYISILSDKVPGWMKDTSAGMSEHDSTGTKVPESAGPDLSTCTSLSHQQMILTERELEQESGARDLSSLTESDLEKNVKN